jgi:2-methylcitrate dehydratase PrpD
MNDPAVLRQRAKIQLVGEDALEQFMPRRAGIVEVTLTDGRMVAERVDDVRGTSENPMNREEIIAKARDLITPVLGTATFQKLADRIFDLERLKNVRELRTLLQHP